MSQFCTLTIVPSCILKNKKRKMIIYRIVVDVFAFWRLRQEQCLFRYFPRYLESFVGVSRQSFLINLWVCPWMKILCEETPNKRVALSGRKNLGHQLPLRGFCRKSRNSREFSPAKSRNFMHVVTCNSTSEFFFRVAHWSSIGNIEVFYFPRAGIILVEPSWRQ